MLCVAPKVTVFIDYQNAHMTGHEKWCPPGEQAHHCLIDPLRLAEKLVAGRAPGGTLEAVRVYRGRPDSRIDAHAAARSDKQAAAWSSDPRVTMVRRPLSYPRDFGQPTCFEKPREKGIDVSLAIDMVRMALNTEYEVGILFSRDNDLLPALELVIDLPDVHTEVATWEGASRLSLKYRKLYCHKLPQSTFAEVRDPRLY
jgi:uncharacterized LabA/DUF88 family protein